MAPNRARDKVTNFVTKQCAPVRRHSRHFSTNNAIVAGSPRGHSEERRRLTFGVGLFLCRSTRSSLPGDVKTYGHLEISGVPQLFGPHLA